MIEQFRRELEAAGSVALVCHVSPDMDTLGSAAALRVLLEGMGKTAVVYAQDEVPERFLFLDALHGVRLPDDAVYDLCVAVDVSDRQRMGEAAKVFDHAKRTAMIDHHPTTAPFAPVYVIRPQAAATAQIVTELCGQYGWSIPQDAAMCLWAGMSTDSGNFSFDNVSSGTFRAAAVCVENGAQPSVITEKLYRTSTEGHIRLLGRVLDGLELSADGRVALLRLTQRDLAECRAAQEDGEGIINCALEIESVRAVAMLSERDGFIKCSLRARAPYDVAQVAVKYGGGGHVRAAGCSFAGKTIEEAGAVIGSALADAVK